MTQNLAHQQVGGDDDHPNLCLGRCSIRMVEQHIEHVASLLRALVVSALMALAALQPRRRSPEESCASRQDTVIARGILQAACLLQRGS